MAKFSIKSILSLPKMQAVQGGVYSGLAAGLEVNTTLKTLALQVYNSKIHYKMKHLLKLDFF